MTEFVASIVIPTRNRPQAVIACLDALAAQTMPSGCFEVIVVDDGSEPPLSLDLARWSAKFPLKLIRQENTGPAAARNRGVAEALGEFVAFTDDDCLPTTTWLEKLVAALREHPGSLVGGSTFNGLEKDIYAGTSQLILQMVYEHFNRDPADAYFFASNNMACRRDDFLQSGGFDPSFRVASEDREFCDRWRMQERRLLWIREALVEHRHSQSFFAFSRLHFRYGKGAKLYKDKRKQRQSGSMGKDLNFHRAIPSMAWQFRKRFSAPRFLVFLCLIIWWEAVNALGFFCVSVKACDFGDGPGRQKGDAPSSREQFSKIYRDHSWGGRSRSGPGSDPEVLRPYARLLNQVLREHDVRTVVDVGCGDWALGRTIDWSGFDYTGVDIVPDVIAMLNAEFRNEHLRFTCLDLTSDPLPHGDLCIIKDVLQHLPNDAVSRFLETLPQRFRAALITNDVSHVQRGNWRVLWKTREIRANIDITGGGYRPLALMEPPFGLRATRLLTFPLRFPRQVFGHPGVVFETKEVLLWELGSSRE